MRKCWRGFTVLRAGLVVLLGMVGYIAEGLGQYSLKSAFPNLLFSSPVDLQHAGDGSGRLFVVERAGVIRVFQGVETVTSMSEFLNIKDSIVSGGELGLLGLAFHPQYATNGYFYVNYTADNPLRSVIARYRVTPGDPLKADSASKLVLLEVAQPYTNHNGGQVAFGPDGYLYIALGDGGSGGDPQNNGQNRSSLLGKILRIDVDTTSGGKPYGIPADNPFVGNASGWREEIYAYGLRNPWRFSFDPVTNRLWAADVGQNRVEEIDIIQKGENYGWRIMEGTLCYDPSSGCDTTGLKLPVWEYDRSLGYSITGGYVYRGSAIPSLVGKYVYGDYVSRRIWALEYDGTSAPTNQELVPSSSYISSFGVDASGEIYVCDITAGKMFLLTGPATTAEQAEQVPSGYRVDQNYPNPFNPTTEVSYSIPVASEVDLRVVDFLGREVAVLVQRSHTPGNYRVTWNAEGMTSGIYFFQLRAGGEVFVRKAILLR